MKIITVKDQVEGGKKAFEILNEEMKANRVQVLGLATGSTPVTFYQEVVKSDLDFSDVTSVNLDEYVGLSKDNDQSYDYFMHEHLFNAKPFKENYLPNGLAEDAEAECARYDQVIEEHPIDIQILGIGENAHIGFNEPGTSFEMTTHKVKLTDSTIEANSRNFKKKEDVPTYAYSMGIKSIMSAKKIILLAFGEQKAQAIKDSIEGPVTEEVPGSVLQNHADVTIIADEKAASLLSK
ncbi:glucosamine-6-phosphate deaminase [Vagococcus xieshaowenii]|uniref:Glucosamine-6-phosphate deaminase n=1 Tax=Vagococcus xieshaowenii TaxID=2562451 RepID=A0AAJ5EFW6_9ENTE|nr:glucosamine-6-phosphate deaminase [Vagococcus xieshaowenii]QCA28348.1 glucosamine-6-phosphate deaminase [Vagococcus xieshaowenii]TFZ42264.1 glucosamine-6-phosphate deaminase [Vagococcus xieshaowenii]